MKSRKADVMKNAGIDPIISDFCLKKARLDPGFFMGACMARYARFIGFFASMQNNSGG